jgi:glutathione synthase/RimK-type ligase-like ATP-grasp enzyme
MDMSQKNVLVIFSYHDYGEEGALFKEHVELLNTVQGEDHKLVFHYGALCDMVFTYDGKDLKVDVPGTAGDAVDFDFVFFQRWMRLPQHALALAVRLEQAGVPYMSLQVGQQIAMSKLAELAMFVRRNVPTPKTVVAKMDTIRSMVMSDEMPFTYPFILKDVDASMGTNNFLIRSFEDLADKQDRLNASSFMAQEFIPNDCDYRFVVVEGEVLYVLRRTRDADSHLNNTSQGGMGAFVDLKEFSDGVVKTVLQAAESVGRFDYAGVDIILAEDGLACVLEVNRSPAIQTGHDAEYKTKLLVKNIAKKLGMDSN